MNAPPPLRRWLPVSAKAGLIGRPADGCRYTTSKSSSGSGGVWFLMYSFHTSSVTFPLVATQYPRAHRCWPQYRFLNRSYSVSNRCERLLTEYERLKKRYWGQPLWARGYWVATSGNVTDEVWKEYIKNQTPPEPDDDFEVV